jgi:CheY-like chemotaxis protein
MNQNLKKVLIIDDDGDFRTSTRVLLENHNYLVSEAESGKKGIEKIKAEKPDLIVLDIMMESLTEGYFLTHLIKFKEEYKAYQKIPILMVSSIQEDPRSRFPFSDEAQLISPDYYFGKPLDIEKFLNRVDKILVKN